MDNNYASRAARFNALLRLGQMPGVDGQNMLKEKQALMGNDIDDAQLRQFAGDQLAVERGIEKIQRTTDPEGNMATQIQTFSPEEMERKKQAIEMLLRGGK